MKIDYPFYGLHRKRPMVLLNIINPLQDKQQKFYCLLDTSADGCIFNADLAKGLGHNFKGDSVKQGISFGLSGKKIPAYLHTFILELLHPVDKKEVIWRSEKLEIKCVENINLPPLLGTDEFLSEFAITFDYANQLSTLYF